MSDGEASVPRIQLLGGFAVRCGGRTIIDDAWNRRKSAALVKALALQPERSLHREQVFDALWPELTPASAANNLHKNLHYLRIACEEQGRDQPLVTTSGGLVALDSGSVVDVEGFRSAARRARELRTDSDAHERALALYSGDLLPLDRYETWASAPREDLHELYRGLAIAVARLYEMRGAWAAAIDALSRVCGDAADEEVQRALMRAHALAGDSEAAGRVFERTRAALSRDLGVEPEAETEVLRAQIASGGLRPNARAPHVGEEPLVGREPEMARLVGALDDAARGRGGLALIGGEPGIGKTRLAEELVAHAHLRGARVLWGRCDQSDTVPAYWQWIQALRGFGAERASDGDRDSEFSRMIAAEGEHGTLTDPRPEKGRFRLFDTLTTFLRRAARERPILLVLDDLHEADVTSLQLLRHVAREAGEMPSLLVGTYRDVELTPAHPLTAMMGELVREHLKARIALSGLSAEQVGRFVHATAGVTPAAAAVEVLHRETEGNPFFVKQCALMLDDEAARRTLRSGQLSVPPNVRDAIVRRLATLSVECREALEVAAVAGHVFDVALLRGSTPLPAARLLDVLHEATSARIVHGDDTSRESYSFWHGLIRHTLYDGMSAARRTSLHRRIAESLESRAGADQRVAELAHHCFEAALGDGDAEKAIGYTLKAGEEALAVYAWDQALRHWEMARRLLEQNGSGKEALADILERLPVLISNVGEDFQTGIDYLERAIGLREQLGHAERAAEDHSKLGIALSMHVGDPRHARTTNLTRALEHYRAAEPILGGGPDRPSVAMFYAGLATVAFSGLQIQDGLAAAARAMEVAERLNMTGVWATATLLRGGVLKLGGRLAESASLLERAYDLADQVNAHQVAFYTSTNLADWTEGFDAGRGDLLFTELSRPRNATPSVQRTTLINDIGCGLTRNGRLAEARAQLAAAPAAFLRTMLQFYDGEWDAVETGLLDGIDILRQVGNKSSLANRLNHLAALYLARDDLARAEQMLDEELALAIEGGAMLIELRARAELALVTALTARPKEAAAHLACCREILANGEEWGRKAGRVALAEGIAAQLAGDTSEAERRINCAIEAFRSRALPWEEADARLRYARLLDRSGHAGPAAEQRQQAIRTYRAIGAGPAWIARAEAPSAAGE